MIEVAVTDRMLADATVAGLVTDRVYPQRVAGGMLTFPRVVYQADDDNTQMCFDGPSALREQRVTFSAQALSYESAESLASAVIALFDGQMGDWSSITVQGAFLAGGPRRDCFPQAELGDGVMVYVAEIDVDFWFTRDS